MSAIPANLRAAGRNGFGIWLLLGAIATAAAIVSPSFSKWANIRDLLTQVSPLGVVVVGQTCVLLVRGMDLSVASLMATVAVLATTFNATSNLTIIPIVVVCLGFAALVGLVNGWLVTARRVSPFLATLATAILLQGLRFCYTGGAPSGALPSGFRYLGTGTLLGVPVNVLVLICISSVMTLILVKTKFGRKVYIVGRNSTAAYLVGINANRITILCYVICSTLAGVGGLLLVGYVGMIDNWVGRGYELDSIVAAVMGGVALSGGRGTVIGALGGTLLLVALFNIILIAGFPVQVQLIIKGIIVILAVALQRRTSI